MVKDLLRRSADNNNACLLKATCSMFLWYILSSHFDQVYPCPIGPFPPRQLAESREASSLLYFKLLASRTELITTLERIILLRNPGCRLENVPYTETHYAPADISDTSGDTRIRKITTCWIS